MIYIYIVLRNKSDNAQTTRLSPNQCHVNMTVSEKRGHPAQNASIPGKYRGQLGKFQARFA